MWYTVYSINTGTKCSPLQSFLYMVYSAQKQKVHMYRSYWTKNIANVYFRYDMKVLNEEYLERQKRQFREQEDGYIRINNDKQ